MRARAHTHVRMRTRAHTHTRAQTHRHTPTRAHTHNVTCPFTCKLSCSCGNGEASTPVSDSLACWAGRDMCMHRCAGYTAVTLLYSSGSVFGTLYESTGLHSIGAVYPNLFSLPYPLIRLFIYEYTLSSLPLPIPQNSFF
jgi:hypothetical protein